MDGIVNAAMNGAQAAFTRKEEPHSHNGNDNGSCGTGDTTQRDELLAKIAGAKKAE